MIEIAGGTDAIGVAGEKSRTVELGGARAPPGPRCVVAMPCGLYADDSAAEAQAHIGELAALGAERLLRGRRRLLVLAARAAPRRGLSSCSPTSCIPGRAAPPEIAWRELELPG